MGITTTKSSGLTGSLRATRPARERHLRLVPPLGEAFEPAPTISRPAPAPTAEWVEPGEARRSLAVRLDLDGLRLTGRGRVALALASLTAVAPLIWGATAFAH